MKPGQEKQFYHLPETKNVPVATYKSSQNLDTRYSVLTNAHEMQPTFDFSEIQRRYEQADPTMRLLQALVTLDEITFTNDDSTWKSSTNVRELRVTIGTQKLPKDIASLFKWGTTTQEAENIVKLAHETSHVLQARKQFTNDWVRHTKKEKVAGGNASYAFIYLYDLLSENRRTKGKPVTGLPTLPVYHAQTEQIRTRLEHANEDPTTGIDVQILEDITELIAAYLLSDEYFAFRLQSSGVDEAYKETITKCIIQLVHM